MRCCGFHWLSLSFGVPTIGNHKLLIIKNDSYWMIWGSPILKNHYHQWQLQHNLQDPSGWYSDGKSNARGRWFWSVLTKKIDESVTSQIIPIQTPSMRRQKSGFILLATHDPQWLLDNNEQLVLAKKKCLKYLTDTMDMKTSMINETLLFFRPVWACKWVFGKTILSRGNCQATHYCKPHIFVLHPNL